MSAHEVHGGFEEVWGRTFDGGAEVSAEEDEVDLGGGAGGEIDAFAVPGGYTYVSGGEREEDEEDVLFGFGVVL